MYVHCTTALEATFGTTFFKIGNKNALPTQGDYYITHRQLHINNVLQYFFQDCRRVQLGRRASWSVIQGNNYELLVKLKYT